MTTSNLQKPVWLRILRWTARIIALLFVIILFFMFTGEDMSPLYRNAQLLENNYLILNLLWILTPIGYLIGLWKEGPGGLISFASTLIHIFLLPGEFQSNSFYMYLIISPLLIPSILYLIYWYFNGKIRVESNIATN